MAASSSCLPLAAVTEPHGAATDLPGIYEMHVDFVWRLVARLGVAPDAVADAVQDVFLVVHRRLADFDGRATIRAWLAGICRGVAANRRRAAQREQQRLRLLCTVGAPQPLPADRRVDLGRVVGEFLDGLDEDQRMSVLLVDVEGMSAAEVAEILGVPRNTIYSRLRLVRTKLRRRLAELDMTDAIRGSRER
jgi:RNA polymerase sigma-70 factor (ECF subfamily)